MATRNFWIDASIDGRKKDLTGGPKSRGGGFDLDILIRNKGARESALRIHGRAKADGTLVLSVYDGEGRNLITEIERDRD